MIQNISNAARQQAASAGHISNTMNVIQEITSQTSAGTSATAAAIGNLAGMAIKLRESVAGFKLPEEMSGVESDAQFATASVAASTGSARSRFARSHEAVLVEDGEDDDKPEHKPSRARG